MGVENLLSALRQMNVMLWIENNKLNYLGIDNLLTDDLKKIIL